MDGPNTAGTPAITDKAAVESISVIRADSVTLLEKVEALLEALGKSRHPAGREIALVKTKLQEARMWAGMGLSHFDTGFKPTDMPGQPESKSKAD